MDTTIMPVSLSLGDLIAELKIPIVCWKILLNAQIRCDPVDVVHLLFRFSSASTGDA
jgi:hypothetical protein